MLLRSVVEVWEQSPCEKEHLSLKYSTATESEDSAHPPDRSVQKGVSVDLVCQALFVWVFPVYIFVLKLRGFIFRHVQSGISNSKPAIKRLH